MFLLSANLNFLFCETPCVTDRLAAAKAAGFSRVEIAWFAEMDIDALVAAQKKTGLEVTLVNSYFDKPIKTDTYCHPDKVAECRRCITETFARARLINCKTIHIVAGTKADKDIPEETYIKTYVENVKWACTLAEEDNVQLTVEPVCSKKRPGFLIDNVFTAEAVVAAVAHPRFGVQLDTYHLQLTSGDVFATIDRMQRAGSLAYIQVAQVPRRGEPGSAGDLDYGHIFRHLVDVGYRGVVALEYTPTESTEKSLVWLRENGYLQ